LGLGLGRVDEVVVQGIDRDCNPGAELETLLGPEQGDNVLGDGFGHRVADIDEQITALGKGKIFRLTAVQVFNLLGAIVSRWVIDTASVAGSAAGCLQLGN
jgi:hypothetical protein